MTTDLELIKNIRKSIVNMVHKAKVSHIGSAFSIVDILYLLYFKIMKVDPANPQMPERDKFILSKAHASAALYATLAHRGFFPMSFLDEYCSNGGKLPAHLDMEVVPGLEISAGSLGHGFPIGLGMALANKRKGIKGKVYSIISDGECNEGSIWEAAMLAPSQNLTNLVAIIDYNKIQSFGATNEIINQVNLKERWQAFGWQAIEIDGHHLGDIESALRLETTKPKAIIAHTTKGKGVSFMEDKLAWHYKSPNDEELKQALEELS